MKLSSKYLLLPRDGLWQPLVCPEDLEAKLEFPVRGIHGNPAGNKFLRIGKGELGQNRENPLVTDFAAKFYQPFVKGAVRKAKKLDIPVE